MIKTHKMKVGVMLGMAFLCVILCGVFVTLFASIKLSSANDQQKLTDARLGDLQILRSIQDNVTQQTTLLLAVASGGDAGSLQNVSTAFQARQKASDEIVAHFRTLVDGAKSIPGINLKEVEEASDLLGNIEQAQPLFVTKSQQLLKGQNGDAAGMRQFIAAELTPAQEAYRAAVDGMVSYQARVTAATAKASTSSLSGVFSTLFILTAFSVVVGGLMSWLITRKLRQQLGGEPAQAQALAAAIADGNLTSPVSLRQGDNSSLLASLAVMQSRLRELVASVKETASSVATASEDIARGNTELSSRTEQQAAALQQTAASMEELTATVKSNAAGAAMTAGSAREAATRARNGGESVGKMTQTMAGISVSAAKVRDITSVIEGIAFQTNILALNAAVEAARAGEQGRGFAVVAGEVRNLAQRSAVAAREIKEVMAETSTLVAEGVAVTDSTATSIISVVDLVGELADAMDEIALASGEQMQGISQVHIAVSEMDGVTQQNATLVQASAVATGLLEEQVHALTSTISRFRIAEEFARPAPSSLKAPTRALKPKTAGASADEWVSF
ncbi:methyl-accepting chemotaxis protein [Duffyella gerundensis]|uniref:methyl-accepting chemotaxis protein n=1 Tax=Duffyella TaxID=3026546 RepID=UPI003F6DDBC7